METETIKDLVSDFIRNTKDKFTESYPKSSEYFRVVPLTLDNLSEYTTGKENKGKVLKYDVLIDWLESRKDDKIPNSTFTKEDIARFGFNDQQKIMFQEIYTDKTKVKEIYETNAGGTTPISTKYRTTNGKAVKRIPLNEELINSDEKKLNPLFQSYFEYVTECKREYVDANEIQEKKKEFKKNLLSGMISKALDFSEKGKYDENFKEFEEPNYSNSTSNYKDFPDISRKIAGTNYKKAFDLNEPDEIKIIVDDIFRGDSDIIKEKNAKYFFKDNMPSTKIIDFNLYLDRIVSDKSNIKIKYSLGGEVIERITVDWGSINEMTNMYYPKPTDYTVNPQFYLGFFTILIVFAIILVIYGIYKYPDNQKTTLSLVMTGLFLLLGAISFMYLDMRNFSEKDTTTIIKYTFWLSLLGSSFAFFIMFSVGLGQNRGNDEKISSTSDMSRNNFYLEGFLVSMLFFVSIVSLGLIGYYGPKKSNKLFFYGGIIMSIMSISFFVYLIDRSIRKTSPINVIGAIASLTFLALGIILAGTNLPDFLSFNKNTPTAYSSKIPSYIKLSLLFFTIFSLGIIGYSFTKSETESEKIFLSVIGFLSFGIISYIVFMKIKNTYDDVGKINFSSLETVELPQDYKKSIIYLIIEKFLPQTTPNLDDTKDKLYKIFYIFKKNNPSIDFNNLEILFNKIISANNSVEFFYNDYLSIFTKLLSEITTNKYGGQQKTISRINNDIIQSFKDFELFDRNSIEFGYSRLRDEEIIENCEELIQLNKDILGEIKNISDLDSMVITNTTEAFEKGNNYKNKLLFYKLINEFDTSDKILNFDYTYQDFENDMINITGPISPGTDVYTQPIKDLKKRNEFYFFIFSYISKIFEKYIRTSIEINFEQPIGKQYIIDLLIDFQNNPPSQTYQSILDQNNDLLQQLSRISTVKAYRKLLVNFLYPAPNRTNLVSEINKYSQNLDLLSDQTEKFKQIADKLFGLLQDLVHKKTIYNQILAKYNSKLIIDIASNLNYYSDEDNTLLQIIIQKNFMGELENNINELGKFTNKYITGLDTNLTNIKAYMTNLENYIDSRNSILVKTHEIGNFYEDETKINNYIEYIKTQIKEYNIKLKDNEKVKERKINDLINSIELFSITIVPSSNITALKTFVNTSFTNMEKVFDETENIINNLNLSNLEYIIQEIGTLRPYPASGNCTLKDTMDFIRNITSERNKKNNILSKDILTFNDYYEFIIIEKMILNLFEHM